MERLKMQTPNQADINYEKLVSLFSTCVTETVNEQGQTVRAIDAQKLAQEINSVVLEQNEERYQFTWPDKRKAVLAANAPTGATLRPCREESVNFDTTQNLYIEGDNLEVLKCLKETYSGKVKMIYIDPPYNTGNDFVYEDNFAQSADEYLANSGQYDEQGNRLVTNTESNGRFHTDWLNMIYPRLKVARDLLTDDGVIFISIDDNEDKNMRAVADEIFGSKNFLAQVVWERAFSPINLMKHFSPSHDYVLVYAKNADVAECLGIPRTEEANNRYSNPDNDPRGVWMSSDISVGPAIKENIYPITTPSGRIVEPPAARSWRLSAKAFAERLQDNRIWFGPDGDGVPRMKRFLSELRKQGMTPTTIWKYTEVGHSQDATKALAKLFDGKKYFDYPKPVALLKRCLSLYAPQDCIVMDFFSGSGTFAHAVMELNAEDGGTRRYILVQAKEKMVNPANVSLTFDTIAEFAEERIRRAGKKIKEESPLTTQDLDTGFRVLKLDSTNMKEVYYAPQEMAQKDLFDQVDNVKPDRSSEDLLFQVMLELGATLDSKISTDTIDGKTVYNVAEGFLIACFDTGVTDNVITAIAKQQPQYAVLRDSSYADDSTATNFEQIFKTYSSNTGLKTL